MKAIPEVTLDNLTRKVGARMLIVISMDGDGCAVASHGRWASEKDDARRLAARITAMMNDGTLASFPTAELVANSEPVAERPPRKVCSQKGCRRTAGRGGLCEPHRLEERASSGLDPKGPA